ncbi:hypothetical protein KCU85_g6223, partial [Aureobasidium melanogenum]
MNRGRSAFSPPPPKKPYTLAALDKPPILRRNSRGMFMTTEEIERDDARMLAQERARPSSRPPVNKPEECFPASGWPTGPQVQESEEEEMLASEVFLLAPSTPPPIPVRSPLRPRPAAAAALAQQHTVQPDSPSSSLYEEGAGLGFHQGNPWSLTGRLPPVVGLAPPSLPPSAPSEYLGSFSSAAASVSEDEGPRGVDYNPDTTGLTSAFSASSSSGGSLLVSNGTIESDHVIFVGVPLRCGNPRSMYLPR